MEHPNFDQPVIIRKVATSLGVAYWLRLDHNNLKERDAVLLIDIMRRKARQLNGWFGTNKWTPRKIDMILWASRGNASCS